MVVRLAGQRYRLLRALDDGASDAPDPGGREREEILLRADLPDMTPHVPKEELLGRSPFLGSMVEILASAIAQTRAEQKDVGPDASAAILRSRLGGLFDAGYPDRPKLVSVSTDGLQFAAPKGGGMRMVTAPKPWITAFPRIYFRPDYSAPTDIIMAGGGECQHTFIYANAIFKATYGEHLIDTWHSVRGNIEKLLERSRV
jgi:hypothetical protein